MGLYKSGYKQTTSQIVVNSLYFNEALLYITIVGRFMQNEINTDKSRLHCCRSALTDHLPSDVNMISEKRGRLTHSLLH